MRTKILGIIGGVLVLGAVIVFAALSITPINVGGNNNVYHKLQNATYNHDLDQVASLINEHNINLNSELFFPDPPIAIAVQHGSLEMVDLLITYGASLEKIQAINTLLETAVINKDVQMIHKLVDSGLNINLKNHRDETAMRVAILLTNDPGIIQLLVSLGMDVETADLQEAARTGSREIYDYLLGIIGTEAEQTADEYGQTLLHFAATSGDLEFFKYIHSRGFDIYARTEYGESVLHLSGSKTISEYLLSDFAFGINELSDDGWSPLVYSLSIHPESIALELASFLLEAGAEANAIHGSEEIPLHRAVSTGRQALAALLIEHSADVNARDSFGDTALHYAAFSNQEDIVKLLLDAGADRSLKNRDGLLPVDLAIQSGNRAIIKLLE